MGHLSMSALEALLAITLASLLLWAPLFGFAYARRKFGGSAANYFKAYLAAAALTVALFLLLAVAEKGAG